MWLHAHHHVGKHDGSSIHLLNDRGSGNPVARSQFRAIVNLAGDEATSFRHPHFSFANPGDRGIGSGIRVTTELSLHNEPSRSHAEGYELDRITLGDEAVK